MLEFRLCESGLKAGMSKPIPLVKSIWIYLVIHKLTFTCYPWLLGIKQILKSSYEEAGEMA